jgi:hypothetical protein
MRSKPTAWVTLIALGVWLSLGDAGCSKGPPPVNQTEIALKLPGATNVFAALARKDYEGAMAAWAKLKDSASDDEQRAQFSALTREFKAKLAEASTTDPKAAEAYNALRAFMTGR